MGSVSEIKAVCKSLEEGGFSDDEKIEFLADEFQQQSENFVKAFRVAFGATSTNPNVLEGSRRVVLCTAFGHLSWDIVTRSLKRAGRDPLKRPKAPSEKNDKVLELQGSSGEAMTWGKIYLGGSVIQVTFSSADMKTAGPFLRSLGLTIVDERTK